jgi:hypothetical protein
MRSFSLLLLALTGTTTTLAAPAATFHAVTPNPAASLAGLSKRATFYSNNDDDYCGEGSPTYYTDASAPLAADCKALVAANAGPGYWVVSAAETTAEGPEAWIRLAASGTCAVDVQWSDGNRFFGIGLQDYRFGTNDLQFYVNSYALENVADGRVGVQPDSVYCYSGTQMVYVNWRVAHT